VQVDRFLVRPCLPGLPSLCSVMARIWHALARMPPPRLEGEGYAAPVARVLNQIGQRLTTRPQHRPRRRGQGRARATPTPKARLLTIVLVSSNGTSGTRVPGDHRRLTMESIPGRISGPAPRQPQLDVTSSRSSLKGCSTPQVSS
jgi:hypothetical protein